MEFLNANAGGIQALFSALIFAVTVVYVLATLRMLEEMKQTRKINWEIPDVNIRLERLTASMYELIIENIGNAPAYNLTFGEPKPILKKGVSRTTENIGFIKNGITYLGVRQSYQTPFLHLLHEENREGYLKFNIEYKDVKNNTYRKEIDINLSLFEETGKLVGFEDKLIEQLKQLNQKIDRLAKNTQSKR